MVVLTREQIDGLFDELEQARAERDEQKEMSAHWHQRYMERLTQRDAAYALLREAKIRMGEARGFLRIMFTRPNRAASDLSVDLAATNARIEAMVGEK